MNDVVCGADLEKETYSLHTDSKEILSHGSFNLRKFITNFPSLQKKIEANLVQKESMNASSNIEVSEETYVG